MWLGCLWVPAAISMLAGTHHEIDFVAIDLLLEDPKPCLLLDVEDLIETGRGLPDLGRGIHIQIVQHLESIPNLRFVDLIVCLRETTELLNNSDPLVVGPAAGGLQRLQPYDERPDLLVRQLQLTFRLKHDVRVEQILKFCWRYTPSGRQRRRFLTH